MIKKYIYILDLILLIVLCSACKRGIDINDKLKETNNLSVDNLIKEQDSKQQNRSSTKVEVGDIVFEVPEYYDVKKDDDGYKANFGLSERIEIRGLEIEANTEVFKSSTTEYSKMFENIMKIDKTEELMVDNNYIIKFIGSSEKSNLVFVTLVNDSANRVSLVTYEADETDLINEKHYNDFNKMIDNAVFKVDDLELVGGALGTTLKKDKYGSVYISGIIKNNTDKKYSYVQITFALLDEDGNKVGTAMTNENNIRAGETWKFEAITIKDFYSYKLDELTGW